MWYVGPSVGDPDLKHFHVNEQRRLNLMYCEVTALCQMQALKMERKKLLMH
jgi:hypothetical protein